MNLKQEFKSRGLKGATAHPGNILKFNLHEVETLPMNGFGVLLSAVQLVLKAGHEASSCSSC